MKSMKRWAPALAVSTVIAAGSFAIPLQASAVDLPDLTPAQVMLLMDKEIKGFSGTIVKTSDLGLPALEMSSMMSEDMVKEMEEKMPAGFEDFIPNLIEQNAITQAVELISGTHKIRVYASEVGMRVQVLDRMSQRDLIVNKDEMWVYDAKSATATTIKFAEYVSEFEGNVSEADKSKLETELKASLAEYAAKAQLDISNPEAVADYLMEMIGESTVVSVGKEHRMAGRSAYQLIATPKAQNSLIESVVISVDSETGMALDVKVYSIEQETPAFQVGFESISFATPDASLFSFTAPAGTTIQNLELPSELEAELKALKKEYEAKGFSEADFAAKKAELEAKYADQPKPEMIGEGWESVIYLPAMPKEVPMQMLENELFADLLTQVPGGKVFSTPLANVLITDSGKVYAGAVTIEFLQQVASR
jgi:outer membrane lipoprotein-sorting protein